MLKSPWILCFQTWKHIRRAEDSAFTFSPCARSLVTPSVMGAPVHVRRLVTTSGGKVIERLGFFSCRAVLYKWPDNRFWHQFFARPSLLPGALGMISPNSASRLWHVWICFQFSDTDRQTYMIRVCIFAYIHTLHCTIIYVYNISTAQGGGGSFQR